MDRWRYSDCEGISSASEISSEYDIRRVIYLDPRNYSPASVSDGFALRRIYVWGSGVWPGGKPSETKHPDPPHPLGGWG